MTAATKRAASSFLNYRGPLPDQVGRVMGPNDLGEDLVVVEQSYDAAEDRTRLGLAIVPLRDLVGRVSYDADRQRWYREEARA
jgi:hypothetical protein